MNKYYLMHTPTMGLMADTPVLEGKTGVEALTNHYPNMAGRFKRIRAWETPEYCLWKFELKNGVAYTRYPKVWYKYHPPKIERIQ